MFETRAGRFATTHWSVVLAAREGFSPDTQAALEQLCGTYWFPLYAYVRRQGHDSHEAQDLTQEFFLRLLDKQYLRRADAARGRFRTFLLTSLKHFLVNEWEKARTAKRGGGQSVLPCDYGDAERRYLAEPVDDLTTDRIFEKRWAMALVERTLDRLRGEYSAANKLSLFEELKEHVWGGGGDSYRDLAVRLETTEGALRIAAHRMREHFRRLLREEVAHTAATTEEIDAELRHLISVLRT
jgi:RNA polymerase sigma factor (sigma-70 family)